MFAWPFTLDGGAYPVGTNAQLPRYRSVVDGFEDTPVDGEHVYANPDYERVRQYLEHFLRCQRRSPGTTAGTFVLPVWDTYDWWRLLKGARLVRWYPKGSHLFTSPEWRALSEGDGTYAFGQERAFRGSTHWPVVVVVHFPPLLPSRRDRCVPEARVGPASMRAGRRLMCRGCAGVEVGLTGMVRSGTCWLVSAGWRPGNEALVRLVTGMLALRTRPSPDRVHQRGVRDITFFLGHFCGITLPATAEDVQGYCRYAVELCEYRMDSSSVRTSLEGVTG
ncbi:hypothetical protein CYMTET_12027 [Cymbomonas tetramitiformis]|uniref:Uncharacterized protein n=1 Tax=Cymbomonas tetramitiformis TaxID=36881 RepID=A0AAE0GL30_9CHLO|nr:hypothetical protein CYMTET_12027 [Cymbomonas tetramitiformis]